MQFVVYDCVYRQDLTRPFCIANFVSILDSRKSLFCKNKAGQLCVELFNEQVGKIKCYVKQQFAAKVNFTCFL